MACQEEQSNKVKLLKKVLFAILPGLLVVSLVWAADTYYNLDTTKIVSNQVSRFLQRVEMVAGLSITGGLTVDTATTTADLTVQGSVYLGSMEFVEDSGQISWVNMPVSATPTAGTIESYTAQIDSNNILTVYSEADGTGGIQYPRVGIGTTTPAYTLHVWGDLGVTATTTLATTTVQNLFTANGNMIFGSASTDLATFTARIASDFIPSQDIAFDLGTSTLKWRNLYVATTTIGSTIVIDGESIAATSSLALTTGDALNITAGAASTWQINDNLTISATGTFTATSTGAMIFGTAGNERIRILDTGQIGIATTSPRYTLEIFGGLGVGTGTTPTLYVASTTGRVGIATSSPTQALSVAGNIYGSGNIVIQDTIDTGEGATEVFAMNQDVQTEDDVTFANLIVSTTATTTQLFVTSTSTLGTVTSGTWQGTAIADEYVADDITLTNITQITSRALSDLAGTLALASTTGTVDISSRTNLATSSGISLTDDTLGIIESDITLSNLAGTLAIASTTGILGYTQGGTGTSTALVNQYLWWGDGTGNLVQVASSTLAGEVGVSSLNTLTEALTIWGTSNQITVSASGTVGLLLATPQDIAAASSPTFAGLTLTNFDGFLKTTAGVIGTSTIGFSDLTGYPADVITAGDLLSWSASTTLNAAVTKSDVGLGSVEDVALSSWAGSGNIVWLGTVGTGTWEGTEVADDYVADDIALTNITQITNRPIASTTGILAVSRGGTGANTLTSNGVLLGQGTSAISAVAAPADTYKVLSTLNGTVIAWNALVTDHIPGLDAAKIISGTFADERITSAATWNAKWDALSDMALTQGYFYIGDGSSNPIATSSIFMDTEGNVGIGTTTPASLLTVYGTTTIMNGNVGIGTVSPSYVLDVYASTCPVGNFDNGNCIATFYSSSSDGWLYATSSNYTTAHDAATGIVSAGDNYIKLGQSSSAGSETETLRPNAAGSETNISFEIPSGSDHYILVDEETADDGTTYVYGGVTEFGTPNFYIAIEENALVTYSEKAYTSSWAEYSQQWDARPSDSESFTVGDIDGLQIGIRMAGDSDETDLYNLPASSIPAGSTINNIKVYANAQSYYETGYGHGQCTQVYVVVDYAPPSYSINRAGLFFDTSNLPDDANITAATTSLYGKTDSSATDFDITVVDGSVLEDPLVVADYGDLKDKTTSGGATSTSGFSTSGYNDITLDSTGRGWVSKTGTTKLGLRSSRDISSTTPTGDEYIEFWSNEKGTGYKPKLVVTYTPPAGRMLSVGRNVYLAPTTGKVGIGTTTPAALLDVYASSSATALTIFQGGSGNIAEFTAGLATSTVTIDNLGRVGIATSSPARMLEVLDTANPQMRITQSGSQYGEFQIDASGNLTITLSGDDVIIPDDNLWVCAGSACPDLMGISNQGNLVVEKNIYVGDSTSDYMRFYAGSSSGGIDYYGTARPKRSIILTAAGGITPTSLGASQTKEDGTNHTYYVLDYSDATTSSAYWQWVMPDSFATATAATSSVDVTIYWTATTTGNVIWGLQTIGVGNNENIDQSLGNTATSTSAAQATSTYLASVTFSDYVTDWVPQDYISFKAYREGANGADTLAADASLVKVKIEYKVKQESD